MLPTMTPRAALVGMLAGLALAGCGERPAPAPANLETASPARTPESPKPVGRARACVTRGAPFVVTRRSLAMTRRSIVTGDRRVLDPLVLAPGGSGCPRPLIVFSH